MAPTAHNTRRNPTWPSDTPRHARASRLGAPAATSEHTGRSCSAAAIVIGDARRPVCAVEMKRRACAAAAAARPRPQPNGAQPLRVRRCACVWSRPALRRPCRLVASKGDTTRPAPHPHNSGCVKIFTGQFTIPPICPKNSSR